MKTFLQLPPLHLERGLPPVSFVVEAKVVLGDHVNLAARLCSHASPRQTPVSESAYERVKDKSRFSFEPLEPIHVKGKSKPQTIYAVHRKAAVAESAGVGSKLHNQ